ncbi:MAG: hypothetical protein QG554_899, partial [Pseudomonadota bacterium]|nr:hypothetical protein [Pseudomonadota bacterium]
MKKTLLAIAAIAAST